MNWRQARCFKKNVIQIVDSSLWYARERARDHIWRIKLLPLSASSTYDFIYPVLSKLYGAWWVFIVDISNGGQNRSARARFKYNHLKTILWIFIYVVGTLCASLYSPCMQQCMVVVVIKKSSRTQQKEKWWIKHIFIIISFVVVAQNGSVFVTGNRPTDRPIDRPFNLTAISFSPIK